MFPTTCASLLFFLCLLELLTCQEQGRVFPSDRAEMFSNYWYEKGAKDIQNGLNVKVREHAAKNVILFIGDGMGVSTLTAARIYKGQKSGRSGEEGSLFFEKFPFSSLVKTFNVDRQVPDSAGTATAYLTGVKGNYETLGVNAHVKAEDTNCNLMKESSVPSILKWAADAGKHTGVVTTARITHATPAASYAHVSFRDWENDALLPRDLDPGCKDIARQLIEDDPGRNLRVIMGGGRKHFLPKNFVDPASNQNGGRNDENLIEKWLTTKREAGLQSHQYKWINSTKGLSEVRSKHMERLEYLFGLFSYDHMSYEDERDRSQDGQPSLTEMTTTAIKMLSKSESGFVLLVEGGRIDHAHHMNWATMALKETVELDAAIEAAVKLVDMDQTLIIVTADHSHTLTINGYPTRGQDITGLSGQNDSTGLPFETLMYTNGPGGQNGRVAVADATNARHAYYSAVPITQSHHGGEDVAAYSDGPFAHLFHGLTDQTFVAHVISFAACIGNYNSSKHCDVGTSHSPNIVTPSICLLIVLILISVLRWP